MIVVVLNIAIEEFVGGSVLGWAVDQVLTVLSLVCTQKVTLKLTLSSCWS